MRHSRYSVLDKSVQEMVEKFKKKAKQQQEKAVAEINETVTSTWTVVQKKVDDYQAEMYPYHVNCPC